ncbi:aldehyde dehydrogenase family protein [Maritimibacter sp. DP07]|uniref:Aldehyde dehydrogenase family protein n=2 Tax=Maritimibacter harenae TaxID=2606218 RepID=A0A845M043_9RHOB|nr:aldehyde dehydrogenase family protein [Maritimibacter harenae]
MTTYKNPELFVNGRWVSATDASSPVWNPATGEQIGACPAATPAIIDEVLSAAETGFAIWKAWSLNERAALMSKAADHLRTMQEEAATQLVLEMGKPRAEAMTEIGNCIAMFEWAPNAARDIADRLLPARDGFRDLRVKHEPVGPVLAIAPWNFPTSLAARKMISALAVGCSVVVRPAPETPSAFGYVVRALDMAGLPAGVVQVVYGDPDESVYPLIDSPVIRKVAFTGSTRVGALLAERAGRLAKPCVMELGGHAPVIVCEDAGIDEAVSASVQSKFRNSGQVCVSPTRFLVHDSIADRFIDSFVAQAKDVSIGDGLDPDVTMGPLANKARVDAIEGLVRDAEAKGGTIRLGGRRLNRDGFFYEPTVVTDVPDSADVMSVEPFGPLAIINRFRNLDDAIEVANATPFALGAYAFTASDETANDLSNRLDAGMVGINSFSIVFEDSPIGGRRQSGWGSEGGPEGLAAYCIPKFVSLK